MTISVSDWNVCWTHTFWPVRFRNSNSLWEVKLNTWYGLLIAYNRLQHSNYTTPSSFFPTLSCLMHLVGVKCTNNRMILTLPDGCDLTKDDPTSIKGSLNGLIDEIWIWCKSYATPSTWLNTYGRLWSNAFGNTSPASSKLRNFVELRSCKTYLAWSGGLIKLLWILNELHMQNDD